MSNEPTNKPVITVYISGPDGLKIIRRLRIAAAKRDMTLSKYVGLLLRKATNNFTDLDIDLGKQNDNTSDRSNR